MSDSSRRRFWEAVQRHHIWMLGVLLLLIVAVIELLSTTATVPY
jgi:hypothetical protein